MQTSFNVNLDNEYVQFITAELNNGKFKSSNEIFEKALDLLKIQQENIIKLRNDIQAGIDSGIDENFDEDTFLKELKEERNSNG
jgi:antitoxin ParD1/3/4